MRLFCRKTNVPKCQNIRCHSAVIAGLCLEIPMRFYYLFFDGVFLVHVRFAVQFLGLDERRSLAVLLVVIVVRRSGVVPRVQAVLGRLVEAHVVQLEERSVRPETHRGHGVVGRLAQFASNPELRLGHVVASEFCVPVRLSAVREHVVADARDQRVGRAVLPYRVRREFRSTARKLEAQSVLHVQPAFGVRIDDRVPFAVGRERYWHFGRVAVGRRQKTVAVFNYVTAQQTKRIVKILFTYCMRTYYYCYYSVMWANTKFARWINDSVDFLALGVDR